MTLLLDDDRIKAAADDFESVHREADRLIAAGQPEQAVRFLAMSVERCPDDERFRTAYGIALSKAGQSTAALDQFENAADLQPDAPRHRNVGVALMALGRIPEAINRFRLAVVLDPEYADAYRLLAEALRMVPPGTPLESAQSAEVEAMEAMQKWLRLKADQPEALVEYAKVLQESGRYAEAVIYLGQACRAENPAKPELIREVGIARLLAGDAPGAADDLNTALRLLPDDVETHLHLAIAIQHQGEVEAAVAQFEQAVLLHQSAPGRWLPRLSREAALLGLRLEAEQHATESQLELPQDAKLLTILVGCYGSFSEYSGRCLDSLCAAELEHCELFMGLNACAVATVEKARQLAAGGIANLLIESQRNLNKDPMMRLLLNQVRTPYVLWLDDDSHFVDPAWVPRFINWIRREHPFDVAGQMARWGPDRFADPVYARFIKSRPWWRSEVNLPPDLRTWAPFVVGGMFMARTAYLRINDFPDHGMTKALDDVALGEMVMQKGGRLVGLPPELLAMVRISDGERRGENYHLAGHPPSM